ncbi:dimethylaniline monooxygenase [N-oxide-forming] 3-like isoform X2 [Contarinia nasturtii]|uniref:dimethylaniline monooxygenase [N-oxide-forming] 3-like isoform X2 n=1 Tax=Contarinia nasturtii TaxID=265458 RepID=UPI0012D3CA08|nr:dimethylaniline monooxygenase [N-oxide-forming] 3-like isoform X2 [Contarinia nasturtii]
MANPKRPMWILLVLVIGLLGISGSPSNSRSEKVFPLNRSEALNIAVIGAGAAGLTSAKNALAQGHNVDIFEKTGALGGIWYYTDDIGKDEYGATIHTPMYQQLRTNTPYQTMEFPDFHFPKDTQSYPSHDVVWKYLDSYARHFGVEERIKYHHLVEKVHSIPNDKWQITVLNLLKNISETYIYDAVFVCTNIFSSPRIPIIENSEEFKGKVMHSRDYRKPETFAGEKVLVIGGGPSGYDIYIQAYQFAKQVTYSFRMPTTAVSSMEENMGYKYSYPFLDESVGIHVEDYYVALLYKHIFNVNRPTMAFIGVPNSAAHNPMCDLQARFALKFISGLKQLPSNEKMLKDMQYQALVRLFEGYPQNRPHLLGAGQRDYYKDLANTAEIESIPEVITDIFKDSILNSKLLHYYRNIKYIISEDMSTFLRVTEEKSELKTATEAPTKKRPRFENSPSQKNIKKRKTD